MLLLYWASSIASIGWVWVAIMFTKRATMREDGKIPTMVKTKTRAALAVVVTKSELRYFSPTPVVTLALVGALSILPFFAANIARPWLAILALSALTLLLFGLWLSSSPFATPIFVESGRTDAGGGKVNIDYKLEKDEQDLSMLAILIVPALGWIAVAWLLSKLGLSGWTLIGLINVIGITLTSVLAYWMWVARQKPY